MIANNREVSTNIAIDLQSHRKLSHPHYTGIANNRKGSQGIANNRKGLKPLANNCIPTTQNRVLVYKYA